VTWNEQTEHTKLNILPTNFNVVNGNVNKQRRNFVLFTKILAVDISNPDVTVKTQGWQLKGGLLEVCGYAVECTGIISKGSPVFKTSLAGLDVNFAENFTLASRPL